MSDHRDLTGCEDLRDVGHIIIVKPMRRTWGPTSVKCPRCGALPEYRCMGYGSCGARRAAWVVRCRQEAEAPDRTDSRWHLEDLARRLALVRAGVSLGTERDPRVMWQARREREAGGRR